MNVHFCCWKAILYFLFKWIHFLNHSLSILVTFQGTFSQAPAQCNITVEYSDLKLYRYVHWMCREVQEIKKIQTPLSLPKAPKWNSASKYSPNFHRTENIVSCVCKHEITWDVYRSYWALLINFRHLCAAWNTDVGKACAFKRHRVNAACAASWDAWQVTCWSPREDCNTCIIVINWSISYLFRKWDGRRLKNLFHEVETMENTPNRLLQFEEALLPLRL